MLKINAIIERASDGTYSVYTNDDMPYGLCGVGSTAHEAVADWMQCYNEMKDAAAHDGSAFEDAEFAFAYDVPSFLAYYAGMLNYTGLAKLTGISSAQLSQYVSGYRKPSKKTIEKIQAAIHTLGQELSRAQFV